MDTQLLEFTRRALTAGVSRAEIAGALQHAGWGAPEIDAALHAYAEIEFPVPVPRARRYLSARDVFVYLVLFAALYTAAYNVGALAFHLIDHAFPDRVSAARIGSGAMLAAIRWNISAIVVALPLFLLLFRRVNRSLAADPTERESRPRLWLTYLTLFVTALWLGGDLMVLVYNALGGELGARFLLKIATVAVIAGGIFSYFLWDVRQDRAS